MKPAASIRPTVVISLTVALTLMGDSMLYSVLPVQYEEFGLPLIAVGLLLSINRYVRFLTNPLAGYVGDRFSIHWPFLIAVALGATVTIIYGLAPGLVAFTVARMVWGGSWSFLRLGGYLTTLHHTPKANLAQGLGLYNALSRCGSLVGMLGGGVLADVVGARPTLILFGAITFLGIPLASTVNLRWRSASEPKPVRLKIRPRTLVHLLLGDPGEPTGRSLMPVYTSALSVGLAAAIITSCLGLLLRLRFGDHLTLLGVSLGMASLTGALLASRWILDLPLTPLYGLLADRIGRPIVGAFATAALVAGLAFLAAASGLWLILAGTLLGFIGSSALVVVLESSAGALAPVSGRAAAMSRYATWADLGSATGPALGYSLVSALGLPIVFVLAALAVLIAMGAFVWGATRIRVGPGSLANGRTRPVHRET